MELNSAHVYMKSKLLKCYSYIAPPQPDLSWAEYLDKASTLQT